MAAVRFQLSRGRPKIAVTTGVDTDYDGSALVTVIIDPDVLTTKSDVIRELTQIRDFILERNWP